jgi:hypothetical protein
MQTKRMLAALFVVAGCGTSGSTTAGPGAAPGGEADAAVTPPTVAPGATGPNLAACVSAAQLATWQNEIDRFDGGFRPTGSAAHEGYIQLLASELAALGVHDVHTEAYGFQKWTPAAWSLALTTGAATGPVTLSGYVPYSGATGAAGLRAPVVYLPPSALPLSPGALANALQDPAAATQQMTAALTTSLAAMSGALVGKIVLFDVPKVSLSMTQLTGTTVFVNDPGATIALGGAVSRTDLSAMLTMDAVLAALASAGAAGAVGILDLAEEAARAMYAPFFGTTSRSVPAVYVDRATGAKLVAVANASGPLLTAKLTLDAQVGDATSENLVAVLPGASDEELVVGSHTDGPNSMEDNGPVAILALASCLAPLPVAARPRTVRIVLSGGHFIGSRGLETYVSAHTAELTARAKVVLELEHLGAREWTEVSPGTMALTGRPEMQLLSVSAAAPFVDASVAFARQFPRTIVATPPVLGEGQNFRVVPLIQFITMPEYLLVGRLPAITSQFTDYDLMAKQTTAFVEMEMALAKAP